MSRLLVAGIDKVTGATNYLDINDDGSIDVKPTSKITTMTHTPITAANATTEVLAANANRKYVLLINNSDEVIYVKLGAAAVLNQGIRLNVTGGSYEMSSGLCNLYTGAINCISTSGGKILLVTEGV